MRFKCYLDEDRKFNGELIYQTHSNEPISSFFTAFIRTPEQYERLLQDMELSVGPDDFNIYNFDFTNQILVISSRHSINHFMYNLNSKKDSASHLYIAIPLYDREETDSYFYYSIPSQYTSVDNSKAYYESGVRYD